ncbi:Stress responsive alpha-beta barrel [Macleaya cordata]|uniref:Stress responsive alpha-beta barrel n=1 Tax=Macleaya cordata TaxID=56857 RepID=A0A200QSX3_MACCD|nr:Stress responsive alpha-beta barrel [Macleaya cordata]
MEGNKEEVKHILVVKFKPETSEERVEELIKEFSKLTDEIKTIKHFIWGKDESTANLHQGNTHVFQLTFQSMDDVNAYIAHPAHMAFAQQLLGATDSIILMDYKPITVNL